MTQDTSWIQLQIQPPNGEFHPLTFTGAELTIGNASPSTLVLNDMQMVAQHVRIQYAENGYSVTNLANDMPAKLDGKPLAIRQAAHWTPDLILEVGRHSFRLIELPAQRVDTARPSTQLSNTLLPSGINLASAQFAGVSLHQVLPIWWLFALMILLGILIGIGTTVWDMRMKRVLDQFHAQQPASVSALSATTDMPTPTVPTSFTPVVNPPILVATATATPADFLIALPPATQLVAEEGFTFAAIETTAPVTVTTRISTPVPATVTPDLSVFDPRLPALQVTLEEPQLEAGTLYWKLVNAKWLDLEASGGRNHIFVEVLDEAGQRMMNQPLQVIWQDGSVTDVTKKIAPDPYAYDFPMSATGAAYSVKIEGLPSDIVHGLGMGTVEARNQFSRTSFELTFQRATKP